MTWTEISKSSSDWLKKGGAVNVVPRGAFGVYDTRGEIALAIHGDAGATVTRRDMEDYLRIRKSNNFSEMSKNTSNWKET